MKFELIIRRKADIHEPPLEEWRRKLGFDFEYRVDPDVSWDTGNGVLTFDEGVVFSFEDTALVDAHHHMVALHQKVSHLGIDKRRWPEVEVRVNGMREKYFHAGIVNRMDSSIREAVTLLKSGRGRKPSQKEAKVRRILEGALPENQDWLK